MEYSAELIKLARAAKTPEELQSLAEEHQIVLSEEQAWEYFGKLNRTGALSDEELAQAAGGSGGPSARSRSRWNCGAAAPCARRSFTAAPPCTPCTTRTPMSSRTGCPSIRTRWIVSPRSTTGLPATR